MSYNQTFQPQTGQGNLSHQFSGRRGSYQPEHTGSYPQDMPARRSSNASGNDSYPPPQQTYGNYSPAGYGSGSQYSGSPSAYDTSPSRMPHGQPTSQPGTYGTSPNHLQPVQEYGPPQGSGWQASYAPQPYPPQAPSGDRRSSTSSHKSHHSRHSHDYGKPSGKKASSKRRESYPPRYDSPRRPTLSDSVMAAWGGLKGAFDARK